MIALALCSESTTASEEKRIDNFDPRRAQRIVV
jgi:hypothetical protein